MMLWQVASLVPLSTICLLQYGLIIDRGGPALKPGRFACRASRRPGLFGSQRRHRSSRTILSISSLDAGRELVLCLHNVTVGARLHPSSTRHRRPLHYVRGLHRFYNIACTVFAHCHGPQLQRMKNRMSHVLCTVYHAIAMEMARTAKMPISSILLLLLAMRCRRCTS